MGIRLLRNESYRVKREGAELVVVGLDEMWTDRADAVKAFAGVDAGDAVVCLQHNPDGVEFLKPFPWQYMLCGHTHGGQADFPIVGPMYVPTKHREYLKGLFEFAAVEGQRAERRCMFVSRGLGYPYPIRLGDAGRRRRCLRCGRCRGVLNHRGHRGYRDDREKWCDVYFEAACGIIGMRIFCGFHARDVEQLAERVEGNRILKG